MSPVQSTISDSPIFKGINLNNNSIAMNIHRKRRESAAKISTSFLKILENFLFKISIFLDGSFCEISRNSYLEGLVDDLPEVDITKLTAGETSVQSAKEQVFCLLLWKYSVLIIFRSPPFGSSSFNHLCSTLVLN